MYFVECPKTTLGKACSAECQRVDTGHFVEYYTRQRRVLPSIRVIALSKVPIPGHRYSFFAECGGPGTRQRHMANRLTKGPADGYFAERCPVDTRQRRRLRHPDAVMATFLCRVLSGTRQSLCRVPEKKYSTKKALSMYCVPGSLCRVSFRLCRVLQTLGKAVDSGSARKYKV
jgi:hypothetical protein